MGFLNFLGNVIGSGASVAAQLQAVFAYLLNAMVQLFTAVWNALVDVFNFLYGILGKVASFFRYVWDNLFKRIFGNVLSALMKAHDWLESKLGPVLQFLQKLRTIVDRVLNTYVKPILNLIQKVRQFLLILKLFHVKWAERLDARLLNIETKMAAVFIEARGILNGIIDAVNIAMDPAKLLRHPILIISIRRSLPALTRSITGLPLHYFIGGAGNSFVGGRPGADQCASPGESSFLNLLPSELSTDDAIPIFGFMAGAGEPANSDVDQLEPLGAFAADAKAIGDCGAEEERLAKAQADANQQIRNAADTAAIAYRTFGTF